MNKDVEGGS